MTQSPAADLPLQTRSIIHRSSGRKHGGIARLVSPSDLGELIKPFVFLDFFEDRPDRPIAFAWHPHSGIATISLMISGQFSYEDSTGKQGTLQNGSVEWMKAGNGVWHKGEIVNTDFVSGFQLWIALPPDQELAPPESIYLSSHDVAKDGPVQVILGSYGTAKSAIPAPPSINYLFAQLKGGEHWRFTPEPGHNVCWVAVQSGEIEAGSPIRKGEIAVFDASDTAIDFYAKGATSFVLGSAIKHPHPLVLGYYSVHSSTEALDMGEAGIRSVAQELEAQGKLSSKDQLNRLR